MEAHQTIPSRSGRRKVLQRHRAEFIAAGVAILTYAGTLPNDYSHDGCPIVRDNPKVNESGQWPAIWTTDYWSEAVYRHPNRDLLYRPVTLTSYRIVRGLFGDGPLPHRIVNLALYAFLCALVARLGWRLTNHESVALFSGAMFVVVPIHTEVLGDIVGRADLLAAVGMILTILAHGHSMSAERRGEMIWWRMATALIAFLAMGSKESAIGLVGVVSLFDALWHRRLPNGRRGVRWISWRTAGRLCYLLVPAAAYLLLRYHALGGVLYQAPRITKTVNVLADAPAWQHALGVIQLWGMYWTKTFWPGILCVNYSINAIRLATDVLDIQVLFGAAVALVLVIGAAVAWRAGRPQSALLTAAILITYAPTSNAFILMQVFFAERIWFIPSIWMALLLGMAAVRFCQRPIGTGACVLLLAGMAVRCWIRNVDWRNDGTLYASAYRDLPDAVGVQYLYGQWLAHHGHFSEGVELLNHALEIDPGFADAYRALGMAYLREGRLAEALHHLQIADLQVPGHPPTKAALVQARQKLMESDTQLSDLRRRAEGAPGDMESQLALIRRLRELGAVEEALARLRNREPDFGRRVEWLLERAVTLQFADRRAEAIEEYRRCVALRGENPQLALELASLLLERREGDDLKEAQMLVDRAVRLAPDMPMVNFLRAELLALEGRLPEALTFFERAIAALPPDSPQRRIFEQRAAALGRRP